MSFSDPLQITYNAVTKDLVKVNQDNYVGEYYLDDGLLRFHSRIAHTIPKGYGGGESHLFRLDLEHLDADYQLERKESVWIATRTDSAMQNTAELTYLVDALTDIMSTGNVTKLLQRQT
jgi:hypothetical protein